MLGSRDPTTCVRYAPSGRSGGRSEIFKPLAKVVGATTGEVTGGATVAADGATTGDVAGGATVAADGATTGDVAGGATVAATADLSMAGSTAKTTVGKIMTNKVIPKDFRIRVVIALTPRAFDARIRSRPSTQVA